MEPETPSDVEQVWQQAHLAIAPARQAAYEAQIALERICYHEEMAWQVWQDEKERRKEYEQVRGA